MRKMGKHIPGLIVTLVVLITAIVFAVMLLNMKVIPTKFIAVIGLGMLVLKADMPRSWYAVLSSSRS